MVVVFWRRSGLMGKSQRQVICTVIYHKVAHMRQARWVVLFLFTFPFTALGQALQDSWHNLEQLQRGQRIQVVDVHMKTLNGEFVRLSQDTFTLRVKKGEVTIGRLDVIRVSTRDTSKRLRNTLIGLGIGSAGGLALGFGIMERETGFAGAVAGTAVFFGGVGAGVGALIPPRTQTIFRAKRR